MALVLALMALIATGLNAALIDADSPGPVGYKVADAPTYVQLSGIFEDHAWTDEELGPPWDQPAQGFRALLDSDVFQTTGSSPLPAALAAIPGWRAVDAQSAFSITTILAGSLAVLAVVLILGGMLWPALLGALLYAGPLTYQLFIDGSQAALIALALVPAIGIVAIWLLRGGIGVAPPLLLALLLAGMLPVYPLLVPLTAASIVLGALVAAGLRWRRGALGRQGAAAGCAGARGRRAGGDRDLADRLRAQRSLLALGRRRLPRPAARDGLRRVGARRADGGRGPSPIRPPGPGAARLAAADARVLRPRDPAQLRRRVPSRRRRGAGAACTDRLRRTPLPVGLGVPGAAADRRHPRALQRAPRRLLLLRAAQPAAARGLRAGPDRARRRGARPRRAGARPGAAC